MRINNNLMAMNTHRMLGINNNKTAKSVEKLSSGLRINRAGDDAAGLAISEKMRAQIKGLDKASRNAQDSISLVQTAEGALNESQAILQRMRELSVQSANDTNVSTDREALQNEVDSLANELTRISDTTEFNTQKLLDGTFTDKIFHIGSNQGQNVDLAISGMDAEDLSVGTNETAATSFSNFDVQRDGGVTGATIEVVANTAVDASATVTVSGTKITITLEDNNSAVVALDNSAVVALVNSDAAAAALIDISVASGAAGATVTGAIATAAVTGVASSGIDISTQASADAAITTINDAINSVSSERSKLGAVQNRLEHTIKNLDTSAENLQASESRIRDVDMAAEMMNFTKNNILQQAAQSMLAQANQQPQGVLQLLR